MRTEKQIFDDLSRLCQSPGYAHALAYICINDRIQHQSRKLIESDLEKLAPSEMAMLIGLLVQGDLDFSLQEPTLVQQYIDQTHQFLNEMHKVLYGDMYQEMHESYSKTGFFPSSGDAFRTSIFYNGDSAYDFQYRDFALKKYENDNDWLQKNKGFLIENAVNIVDIIHRIHIDKILCAMEDPRILFSDQGALLETFKFNISEICSKSKLSQGIVESVLKAFTFPLGDKNQSFCSVGDQNGINIAPLIKMPDGSYLLFQIYLLLEALYESPFYWFSKDNSYKAKADKNRGKFPERFAHGLLKNVFGEKNVYQNVKTCSSLKAETPDEIDVLVLFGDRAIIVETKSKRLSLQAKKGDYGCIRDDFEKGIQRAYEQTLKHAEFLSNHNNFILIDGEKRKIPQLSEIYILCVLSDHYRSLALQVKLFLSADYKTNDCIRRPIVLDLFTLDTMTEMLRSPLYLLSYLDWRTHHDEMLSASDELVILSYYLKGAAYYVTNDKNTVHYEPSVQIKGTCNMAFIDGSMAYELNDAMAMRRTGVSLLKRDTPEGILTRFKSTVLGRIIEQIENPLKSQPESKLIDLGLLLLKLDKETADEMSDGISSFLQRSKNNTQKTGLDIDFRADSIADSIGLTVFCYHKGDILENIGRHIMRETFLRKYKKRATKWFGVCLDPDSQVLYVVCGFDEPWKKDEQMEKLLTA